MKRRRYSIVLPMFVAVTLFVVFHFNLTQKIPGLRCESFGCIGLGVVMMISPVLIAALFFVGGVITAKQQRLRSGCVLAGTSFAFALAAVIAVMALNKLQVNRSVDEACRADPATYCPHTLER